MAMHRSSGIDSASQTKVPFEIVHFRDLPGTPCPCGTARRAFMESTAVPYSFHITQIESTSRVHYHREITETYLILQCDSNSYMELDGQRIPLEPEMAILIPPLTRHRAVGKVKVAIVAWPKFDPHDEWFDDETPENTASEESHVTG